MPARTDSVDRSAPGRRWLYNPVVDADADNASWELVDEIGRLKLADVAADHHEDVRVALRTPPKSKMPPTGVPAANDASPLDSSSSASVGSSPHVPDHPISHSRGSSADTSLSNTRDAPNNAALLPHNPLNVSPPGSKERPHSFSGGLSNADLRRLQQADDSDHDRQTHHHPHQQWGPNGYRDAGPEQPSYPSLATQAPRPLAPQMFTYPPNVQHQHPVEPDRDEAQLDYNSQQRSYNSIHPHVNHALMNPPLPVSQFVPNRPNGSVPPVTYRPSPRGFPQGAPGQNGIAYPTGHHTPHLSLGNTQQVYEMMLPHDPHHPAVTRIQQQHNAYRPTHHHSASDPSALRDPATIALLNNSFAPNMFQPGLASAPGMPPLYGQYYGAPDMATMAARLQSQYTGPYSIAAPSPSVPIEPPISSPTSSAGQAGPSANNRKLGLYKTELCRSWEEKGSCRYGTKCQFAHGEDELRRVARHPKYKTEICKTFWVSGSCPYGKRCCFIHTELSSGATPTTSGTAEGSPAPTQSVDRDHRERSNSDTDASSSVSLLARISQRNQEAAAAAAAASGQGSPTPVDMNGSDSANNYNNFQPTKPAMGSLRVNTVLDGPSIKQNKSAYPSFASNGILLPAPDHIGTKSPGPVTAGPDLGRHNLARMEIVGLPNPTSSKKSATLGGNPRHSFNGTDMDLAFIPTTTPPVSGHSYSLSTSEATPSSTSVNAPAPSRVNGHVRGGSTGTWTSFSRSSLSNGSGAAAYQRGQSPAGVNGAGDLSSPWGNADLTKSTSRLGHEKTTWA